MAVDQVFSKIAELLWTGGLAATPLAIVVGLVCRFKRVGPATRHMLWLAVLVSFMTPAIGALIWRPHWFRSERLLAAAESARWISRADQAGEEIGQAGEPKVDDAEVRPLAVPVVGARNAVDPKVERLELSVPQVRVAVETPDENDAPAFVGPMPVANVEVETSVERIGHEVVVAASEPSESAVPVVERDADPVLSTEPRPQDERAWSGGVSTEKRAEVRSSGPSGPTNAAASSVPVAGVPVPVEVTTHDGDLRRWFERVLSVRDAIASLPPVPTPLWFGGVALLVMLTIWRRCAGLLWLRHAVPADPCVQALVRQVGEALGLARIPRVVFVDSAVSPMIWCGLRPTLVLPRALWRTLDEDSRRAVLVHELAHVRRWDHVLCWLEAVVGALYWWHPVVWWARRRIHEEADASCDAWVTSLFPANRRAYASALLVTKSFVSSRAESRGPWLGVASGSAKKLARRITMVMTHTAAPRMSSLGMCVTALVLATGAFVMPGLACPPVEENVRTTAGQRREYVAPSRTRAPVATPSAPEVMFFGEAPALEAMRGQPEVVAPSMPPAGMPVPPRVPSEPRPTNAPRAPRQPGVAVVAPAVPSAVMPGQVAQPFMASSDLEAFKVGRTPREYRLSPGKLEAFYGMMSRRDVPILVQMSKDHIVIWGNDEEHAVFKQFVRIVDGEAGDAARATAAPRSGRLSDLAKIEAGRTAREAGGERAQWMGGEAEEQYREAVKGLARDHKALGRAADKTRAEAEKAAGTARELRGMTQERGRAAGISQKEREELEQAGRLLESRSDALQSGSKSLEQAVKDLERQIRVLEERAKKLEQERRGSELSPMPANRKAPAAPGMLASLGVTEPVTPCEQACETTVCGETSKSASR